MGKRIGITKEEYSTEIPKRQHALNTNQLDPERVIREDEDVVLYALEDKYAFYEWDGYPVLYHYLIIPKNDSITSHRHMDGKEWYQAHKLIEWAEDTYPSNRVAVVWKNDLGRTVKKFHIHVLVLDQEYNQHTGNTPPLLEKILTVPLEIQSGL